jgi:hypothetical protein
VVFIESRSFTRRLFQLAGGGADSVLSSIQGDLMENPLRGRMVQGLGGIRKTRTSNPARGKGKRSGFRYLYLYLETGQHLHLLFLLDKNEQEDMSEEQRRQIEAMLDRIKRETGG